MTQLSDTSPITGISYGILQPVLQHRWRVLFNTRHYQKGIQDSILTRQATKVAINYVKKQATVMIEQSISGEEHNEILNLCQRMSFMRVDAMDGNDGIYHSVLLHDAKVINHDLRFDYSSSAALCHVLEITFRDISLWEPQKEVTNYDKAKSAIT